MDSNKQRHRRFLKISSKNIRYNWMRKILWCRSKAKAKPQRRKPAGSSSRIVPKKELDWYWTRETFSICVRIFEESNSSSSSFSASTNEKTTERFIPGEEKNFLQNQFPQSIQWSDDRWKVCLAAGGGAKRRFQYCIDDSGIIIYFRALQGHWGRNLIDPSLQDNVVIPSVDSSNMFTILDVRSIFILSSTLD